MCEQQTCAGVCLPNQIIGKLLLGLGNVVVRPSTDITSDV